MHRVIINIACIIYYIYIQTISFKLVTCDIIDIISIYISLDMNISHCNTIRILYQINITNCNSIMISNF